MQNHSKGITYALIAALLWSVLAIIIKYALNFLPPATLAWFRFATAFSILSIYLVLYSKNSLAILKKPPPLALLAAVFLGLNYLFFIHGLNFTTPGNSQIYIQAGPLCLAIIGIVIFREKIGIRQLAGFAIVTAGFIIFFSEQLKETYLIPHDYKTGALWVALAGISWAAFASLQKILVRKHGAGQLNLVIFGLNAILFIPLVDFRSIVSLDPWQFLIALSLGLNTLLAYGSLALALKYTDANKISVITTINPIITFAAMIILEAMAVTWIEPESITILTISGTFIIILGAVMVVYKKAGNNKLKVNISQKNHAGQENIG